jgi:hypothetical protein
MARTTAGSRETETAQQPRERLEETRMRVAETRQEFMQLSFNLDAFSYDSTYGYDSHPSVLICRMDADCNHCHAKKFKGESPWMCCSNGKVKLPPLDTSPDPLLSYMSGTSVESKHFLQNKRKYNYCFQMTSFGATATIERSSFMLTFKIPKQIYHKAGSLLPLPDGPAKTLQINFVGDEEREVDQRCANIPGTRRHIVLNLQRCLHRHNELVNIFKT